jgi:hypothetical protein
VHSIMGFVDKWPSRMQRHRIFEVGRAGDNFQSDPKKLDFLNSWLPLPKSISPISSSGEL